MPEPLYFHRDTDAFHLNKNPASPSLFTNLPSDTDWDEKHLYRVVVKHPTVKDRNILKSVYPYQEECESLIRSTKKLSELIEPDPPEMWKRVTADLENLLGVHRAEFLRALAIVVPRPQQRDPSSRGESRKRTVTIDPDIEDSTQAIPNPSFQGPGSISGHGSATNEVCMQQERPLDGTREENTAPLLAAFVCAILRADPSNDSRSGWGPVVDVRGHMRGKFIHGDDRLVISAEDDGGLYARQRTGHIDPDGYPTFKAYEPYDVYRVIFVAKNRFVTYRNGRPAVTAESLGHMIVKALVARLLRRECDKHENVYVIAAAGWHVSIFEFHISNKYVEELLGNRGLNEDLFVTSTGWLDLTKLSERKVAMINILGLIRLCKS